MTTILLKENELTKNTPLGGNIDVDKYVLAIADFQRIRVEEVLGETLYNKICIDFENDDLVDEYLTLYEDYLVNQQRMKMEVYESRLERWLCKNHLPEYVSNSNNIVNPIKSKLVCGKWYLQNPY